MRKQKLYLLVIILMFSLSSYAQTSQEVEKTPPSTKLESVLVTKGNLIIRETIEIGGIDFGKIKFDAMILYEQGKENQKTKGIRITIADQKSSSISYTVFLDMEEIGSLNKSIEYMIDMAPKLKPEQKTLDIIYSTKGNFMIGLSHNFGIQKFYVSYRNIADATHVLEIDKMGAVKTFMEKGLASLQN